MIFGHFHNKKKKRIYLDYAATTPVRPEVLEAMLPYFTKHYGNAGSVHAEGVIAARAVDDSRVEVARTLCVRADQVAFTSGGTESNNLAILGHIEYLLHEEKIAPQDIEIISTAVEHPSVTKVLEWVKKQGVTVYEAPIDESGRIILPEFEKILSSKTRLVTMHYANSETGVVQNIGKLARIVHAYEKKNGAKIVVHTDAAQAPLWLPCDPTRLGVDMISLDAGKCYGPKGVGVLVYRPKAQLSAVTFGGSQERGIRPGTENTALIVGCAKALKIAQERYEERSAAAAALRDHMITRLTSGIDGCVLNGSKENRLANNINISIPGVDTEFAVIKLDSEGIAASTRSACSGADGGGSQVIRHMTGDEARATSTIRFSLGEETTKDEIDRAVDVLKVHVEKMKDFQKGLTLE